MVEFLKGSVRDLKHVVWPTREETKKYFFIVLVVLILFGLYLSIVGGIFESFLYDILKPLFK